MTILYHYCSNNAFHSIIENQSIWLSSLSLSNDSMEGKLVTEIITRIAKSDKLDENTIKHLENTFTILEETFDGLGFCLSENGDLLSQWRGYASDATGVSIGFSKEYLEQLSKSDLSSIDDRSFSIKAVEYEPSLQEKLIKPTYTEIKKLINKGALNIPVTTMLTDTKSAQEIDSQKNAHLTLSFLAMSLVTELFFLKSNAFREEHEWRLISLFVKSIGDKCMFRPSNNKIVPYREFKLESLGESAIIEVILGPKNSTPNYVFESILVKNGFTNTRVIRSEASYR